LEILHEFETVHGRQIHVLLENTDPSLALRMTERCLFVILRSRRRRRIYVLVLCFEMTIEEKVYPFQAIEKGLIVGIGGIRRRQSTKGAVTQW